MSSYAKKTVQAVRKFSFAFEEKEIRQNQNYCFNEGKGKDTGHLAILLLF